MTVARTEIGGCTVLIRVKETVDIPELQSPTGAKRQTTQTSAGTATLMEKGYTEFKSIVGGLINDMHATIAAVEESERPTSFEVELGLSLTAKGSLWLIESTGESTIKLTIAWGKGK